MSMLNAKQHLIESTERALHLLTTDLRALHEERQTHTEGGCSRTPLHIIAECAMLNGFVAKFLRGETIKRMPPAEREAFLCSFDTAKKALAYLEEETLHVLQALENLDEETLGQVSIEPLGRPMTRFAIAEMAANHMMYHDGQLNYIQTLHGDNIMHWG